MGFSLTQPARNTSHFCSRVIAKTSQTVPENSKGVGKYGRRELSPESLAHQREVKTTGIHSLTTYLPLAICLGDLQSLRGPLRRVLSTVWFSYFLLTSYAKEKNKFK